MTNSSHITNPKAVSRRELLQHGVAISAVAGGALSTGPVFAAAGEDTQLHVLWQRWLEQGERTLVAQDIADEAKRTARAEIAGLPDQDWRALDMAARREWEKLATISDEVMRIPSTTPSGHAIKAAVLPILALRNATAWQHVITSGGNTMRLREALQAGHA